jgi:hypothetical protein
MFFAGAMILLTFSIQAQIQLFLEEQEYIRRSKSQEKELKALEKEKNQNREFLNSNPELNSTWPNQISI